jgi:hypothetical protein
VSTSGFTELAVADLTHRAVTVVVQQDHNRVKREVDGDRYFGAGRLKRIIADQHVGPQFFRREGNSYPSALFERFC